MENTPAPAVPEITPTELVRAIEAGEPVQILDVRLPARAMAGHIDLVAPERFVNLVNSQLLTKTRAEDTGIAPGVRTITVCGQGNSSRIAAAHLHTLGVEAISLRGGMAAYMDALIARPLAATPTLDALVQFDRIGKGSLAYAFVSDGEAFLIDPPRQHEAMLAWVREQGARVVGVADTHVHADYISGASTLSQTLGAPYHLHPADNVYPFDGTPGRLKIAALTDGSTIPVGRATLTVRHNPGHTEGSSTFVLDDAVAFSGDFVFVDSLGRPDLAGRAGEWAQLLWNSLEQARRDWAPHWLVLPGHYASAKERRADHAIAATFGALLASNPALAMHDRDAFLAWATAKASVPSAYPTIKAINAALQEVSDAEATELEVGRNECAVAKPVS